MCRLHASALLIYQEQERMSSEMHGKAETHNALFKNSEDALNVVGLVCLYIHPSTVYGIILPSAKCNVLISEISITTGSVFTLS